MVLVHGGAGGGGGGVQITFWVEQVILHPNNRKEMHTTDEGAGLSPEVNVRSAIGGGGGTVGAGYSPFRLCL